MTQTQQKEINPQLILGDVLPDYMTQTHQGNLYVSLGDLIISQLGYHPAAVTSFAALSEQEKTELQNKIGAEKIADHFVNELTRSILQAAQDHTTVRISLNGCDSQTMRGLIGGGAETEEVNPALGLRGVVRFASSEHHASFALQCQVIKALHAKGLKVEIVVPFVRALSDAATIIDLLAEQGLPRGLNGLKVLYRCDVPAGVLLATRLLQYFDGVVVDIDHLTQLTFGIDKHNPALEHLYDPQNEAVMAQLSALIKSTTGTHKPILILVRALDNYPKLQQYLVDCEENIEVYPMP